jgi:large conductance mechanosensitive channel
MLGGARVGSAGGEVEGLRRGRPVSHLKPGGIAVSNIMGASSVAAKKVFSLVDEFKAFAFKGNVVDLAVGVIIGGAFGKIVSSLVDNIIMPTISVIVPGNRAYHEWAIHVEGKDIPYGKFLGDVVNFLIVAAALFLFIVKFLGWLMSMKKEEAVEPVPAPTKEQELLTEIRDLLARSAASGPR